MDLNADGINDILSGCYSDHNPMAGLFYVLYGAEDGTFAKPVALNGTDDKPLIMRPGLKTSEEGWTENICTKPYAADWNGDGHLDIVAGNFSGTFFVFEGLGKGTFKPTATRLTAADGSVLKVNGVHSDPVIIDWDGDGDLDLVAACQTGEIVWSENTAIDAQAEDTGETQVAFPAKLSAFRTLVGVGGHDAPPMQRGSAEYHAGITAAYDLLDDGKIAEGEAAFLDVIISDPAVGDGYYHLACCYSRQIPDLEGVAKEQMTRRAMIMLRKAVSHGWVNHAHMKSDPDMAPLRELDWFSALMQDLKPAERIGPANDIRIQVVDFNNDGKLDLLIGDTVTVDGKRTGNVWLLLRK